MGIALLTLADLFMPLQSLTSRWIPGRAARRRAVASGLRYVAVRPGCDTSGGNAGSRRAAARPAADAGAARVVRVVRIVERGPSPEPDGRVVISGRMADVCAELDRLAALEATGDSTAPRQLH